MREISLEYSGHISDSVYCIRRRQYRDDVLDYGFVNAHLGSFQRADVHANPGDQHKLDAFAQLVASVDTCEAVQPLVVCTAQHTLESCGHSEQ